VGSRKPPPLPDAEWLAALATNPAYKGIDIGRELAKMDTWLALPKNAKLVKTRARIVAWLNRVDVAVEGAADQPRMNPMNRAVAERALERHAGDPRTAFVRALTTMAAVFRLEVDDLLLEAYWVALRAWPTPALEAGARRLIASHIHFPRPAEWADAAKQWVLEKREQERRGRRALAQSTEPPLKATEVRAMVKDLAAKLSL
jgi:hypothetical protein